MTQPAIIVCDSDALIQLYIARLFPRLGVLVGRYGIQLTMVFEVRDEIEGMEKFGAQLHHDFKKAVTGGVLAVLDEEFLAARFGPGASASGKALLNQIDSVGKRYYQHVDRGEAYTLAAASVLNQPALSHDFRALRVLDHYGLDVPSPVLRVFDLVVFLHQIQELTPADADKVRQALDRVQEGLPTEFRKRSFEDGLSSFEPRLIDDSRPTVGTPKVSGTSYRRPLFVRPVSRVASGDEN